MLIEYSDQGIHSVFFNVPGGGTYTGVPAEGFVTEKVHLSATHCNETLCFNTRDQSFVELCVYFVLLGCISISSKRAACWRLNTELMSMDWLPLD